MKDFSCGSQCYWDKFKCVISSDNYVIKVVVTIVETLYCNDTEMNSSWWLKLKISYPQHSVLSQLLSVSYIVTNPAIFTTLNIFEADGKLFAG